MKESTLSKITASVAVAKGMAQRALAASPNPQWTEYEMQSVDEWIARQDVKLDRPEAIRRLVELGLAGTQPTPRPSPKVLSKASDLAAQQIDELGDPSATDEERQTRKRRLLRGPKEFRDIRAFAEQPKRKK